MKKIMITLGLAVSLLGLVGCNKKQTVKIPTMTQTTTPKKRPPYLPKTTPDVESPTRAAGDFSPLFFTYDESTLSEASMLRLDEIALFLEENPRATLLILGHADERGTEEYNLALGQERAESIKSYLTYQRIDPARISTVSYGEEMPLTEGLDEESLAQNRRGEFEVRGLETTAANKPMKKEVKAPALRAELSTRFLPHSKSE